jgi:choline dehydrogenase
MLCQTNPGVHAMAAHTFDRMFDVVIAGGGSAGCIVASRLTEDKGTSVCLIEAGARDRNPWIHIPLGFGKLVPNPDVNWGYTTEPEPELNNRRVIWPRGKVLGGSGSINGLVFLRGSPSDYDEWERLGATGWGYRDVLPYFKKSEDNIAGANEWRGTGGPMTISNIKSPSAPARAFVETCERLQYPHNPDFNGEKIDGAGFVQLNVRDGWRCSTAVGYLRPNLHRANLDVLTDSHVCKILFEGKRAVGVEVERFGKTERIGARREVVVSGGAINSPQLLLASGIGPGGELQEMGIAVQHDLPGVGKNLQDHLLIRLAYKTNAKGTLNEIMGSWAKSAKMAAEFAFKRSGQLTVGATEATLFCKSRPSEPVPDLQFQLINFSTDGFKDGLHTWPGFMSNFCVCRPHSRGEIKLRDPAGRVAPRIFANYLTHPEDWRMMRAGYRIAEQMKKTDPLKSLIVEDMRPGPDCRTEEDFIAYMRGNCSTVYHPCGTNRMGTDDMAVVDPSLRVRGMDGLRVIDASVMPMIPSSNIHPATIMLAEKGAAMMRAG